MGEINYTKLDWFNQIFCPHCGKLLKARTHIVAHGTGLGCFCDDPEYDTYETYTCSDCGIKANTRDHRISEIEAWKFPKDYQPSITVAQSNYITFLSLHFNDIVRERPVITNKQLATLWISQFVNKLNEENLNKIYEEKIKELFRAIDFGPSSYNKNNINLLAFEHEESFNDYSKYVRIYLYFNKETHEITSEVSSSNVKIEALYSYLKTLDIQLQKLKANVNTIEMPTETEAQDRTVQDREQYKLLKEQCLNTIKEQEDDGWSFLDMEETF